jgi:hypothetical protein
MGFFANYRRKRSRAKARDEAYRHCHAGEWTEAAEVYERMAAEVREDNELIYEDDCHDAVRTWLKANNPEAALRNARSALNVIANSDWINLSKDTVEDICQMVGEFYAAGYGTAADMFAGDINAALAAHNQPLRFETNHGKFPALCPQCGGTLPSNYSDSSVTCSFCGSVIHGEAV